MNIQKDEIDRILEELGVIKDPKQILEYMDRIKISTGLDILSIYPKIQKSRFPGETLEQTFRRVFNKSKT